MWVTLRRALCCCAALLLLCALFPARAFCAAPDAAVIETDIGIQPFDYRRMISTRTENKFSVRVETDGGPARPARIHIRGCGSKEAGMALPTKRLPIELTFETAADYTGRIANSCVKFCNVLTPYELLAQQIAYDMFASLGVPVPTHSFAFIRYNDVDFGVFFALEDINEEFLAKHFPRPFGTLYKGAEGDLSQPYAYSPWFGGLRAVNEGGHERIQALLEALKQGEGFEEFWDMDEALRFLACTAAYGGASSLLTELSNFFLYDAAGGFVLLPWDLSEAFSAEETQNGVDRFRLEFWEEAPPCELFDLLMRSEENRERYHSYIRELCEGFLAPENFDPYFLSLTELLTPWLQRDGTIWFNWERQTPENAPELPVTFRALRDSVHRIRENLLAQLAGTEDRFYVSPALEQARQEIDDEMAFVAQNSFSINMDITGDICQGYTAYCRRRGIARFATGDPAETAAAAAVFAASAGLTAGLAGRRSRKKKRREAKNG